jgi:hypothetical protein
MEAKDRRGRTGYHTPYNIPYQFPYRWPIRSALTTIYMIEGQLGGGHTIESYQHLQELQELQKSKIYGYQRHIGVFELQGWDC